MHMSKPIFTEHDKAYLARFLGGEMVHPTTPFEARVALERAAAATDANDPNERMVRATFLEWANEVDPQSTTTSSASH